MCVVSVCVMCVCYVCVLSVCSLQREELPVLPVEGVLSVVLQVCDALMYLHGRKLVLRSLSSHSVLMVRPTLAKLTGLGFMTSV